MIASIRGEYDDAAGFFRGAVERSPVDPRNWHELGVAELQRHDYSAARTALDTALELAPDSKSTWQAMSEVCAGLGDEACYVEAQDALGRLGG